MNFRSEQTAISVNHSRTSEILRDILRSNPISKCLDYGLGTGRNVKYIAEQTGVYIDGCDIREQLTRSNKQHNLLREKGSIICEPNNLDDNSYNYVINSHVLNVICDDNIKVFVLKDIFNKLKQGGKAFIEVRTQHDIESSKTKERFGAGWKIKKGKNYTYQEAIEKNKMVSMIENVGFTIEKHVFNKSRHIVIASKSF